MAVLQNAQADLSSIPGQRGRGDLHSPPSFPANLSVSKVKAHHRVGPALAATAHPVLGSTPPKLGRQRGLGWGCPGVRAWGRQGRAWWGKGGLTPPGPGSVQSG